MLNYEFVLKKFMDYVEQFDVKNTPIAMKLSHSIHTADLAGKLAKRMELEEEKIEFCKILGLLHDIGRFSQYEQKKSFSDFKTKFDHAKYGVDYLFKENHIEEYGIPQKYYTLIKKAIENHNKLKIDKNLTEEEKFYAQFIRDVDKIDIFRQEATSYEWKYTEPATKKVFHTFFKHQLIEDKEIASSSDAILLQLAFVYDINFIESMELLKDTDNLDLYLSVVEVDKNLEEEFESIKKELGMFIEERMKELC